MPFLIKKTRQRNVAHKKANVPKKNQQQVQNSYIRLSFCHGGNFGDLLGPYIYHKITRKNPILCNILANNSHLHYMICGSILSHTNNKSILWGVGFMSNTQRVINRPFKSYAVRGNLSRQKMGSSNTLGDPALLLPLYYQPSNMENLADQDEKTYKISIIPHATEYQYIFQKYIHEKDINIIQLCNMGYIQNVFEKKIEYVIDSICKSDLIITSSLHGVIVAHAYKIPVIWSTLTNITKNQKSGTTHYKFLDYFSSINLPLTLCPVPFHIIEKQLNVVDLAKFVISPNYNNIVSIQTELMKVCPFLN